MDPPFSGSYRDVIDNLDLALAIYRAVDDGADFMFVEANAGVERIEQVKREDLIGRKITEAFPGVEEFGLLDILKRVYQTGIPERFPIGMYTDDRITGWRDNYVYKLDTGEVVVVYRDETIRKQQEEQVEYLYQVLLAIRNVNQLIVTEKDRDTLLQRACELMVESKGYNGSWIGFTGKETRLISVYGAGFDENRFNQFKELAMTTGLPFLGHVGQSGVHIVEDVAGSCGGCPLQVDDVGSNVLYASLMHDGEVYGLMMVSVPVSMIRREELDLFEEVVADISYALYGLEVEETRIRVEEDLRVSEAKYRSFLDESRDGVTVNVSGMLVYVNPRFSEMIGYSVDELIGSSILDLHAPKYRDMIRDRTQSRSNGKQVSSQYEVELVRKDGSFFPVSYSVSRIIYEGKPSSLTFIRDTTERKHMEDALRESEALFRGFMQSATERFVMFDETMRFIAVNDSWLKRAGLEREDVIGKHVLEVFPELKETGQYDAYVKVLETGESVELRAVESVTKRGAILDITAFKTGKVLGVTAMDISDRVLYQRRLELLHGHAAAMSQAESIEKVSEITRESLINVLGFNRGSLGLVEGSVLNHKYRWGIDSSEEFKMPLDGPGLTVKVVNSGESIRIGNVSEAGGYVDGVGDPVTFSELAVPVIVSGKVVGVINVESEVLDAFSEDDQRIVETLGIHVGSALSRLDREKVVKTTLEELEATELRSRLFRESASDRYNMFDENMCYVEVNDSWLQHAGLEREDVIGKHVLDLYPGLKETGRYDAYVKVLETGESVEYYGIDGVAEQDGVLDVSAFKAGNVLGLVSRDVSEQVRYRRRLESLNEHASQLASQNTVQEVVSVTFQIIEDLFGYNYGSFGLVEGDSLHHIIVPQVEAIDDFYQLINGVGVCPRAVRSGVTQVLNETRTDPDFSIAVAEGVYEPRSELVVPILVDGVVGAVLNVESLVPDAFGVDDVRLVELLANHVGSAINRLSIFDQLTASVSELEASKEGWEELIASIPDPVLINDGSHWVYANQQAADQWGYESPSDIVGLSVASFYSEEEGARLLQRAKDRLEGADVPSRYEQLSLRADGDFISVEVNVQVISFNGEPAILSISRDLSERKRSEARLSALHSFTLELDLAESVEDVVKTSLRIMREGLGLQYTSFQLLEDEMLVTMGVDGSSGVWLALPLSGKGVTTRAAREARTVLLGDVREDPDFVKGSTDSLSELAVPILVENQVLGVLNVESPVLDFFTLDDARLMEILAQNVGSALFRLGAAENKLELERQLLVQQLEVEQEQEMSQMKTRFMSTATHELRTPLSSIQGYTELIQMDEENLTDAQRQYFSVIQRNVQRLTKLTDDLLEQQRLEEKGITLSFEPVNVLALVEMVRSEFTPILAVKHQTLEVNSVETVVSIDRLRLMQVLVNLLSNASKFSPDGSVIVVDVVETDDGVQFSVTDQGVGIGEEDFGKLFTPFPGILVKGNVSGTGLGLSISRGIVELHGGRIWVESGGLGKGSRFSFTIPNKK